MSAASSIHSAWVPKPDLDAPEPSSYLGTELALESFRSAMRRLAGAVHVVTTRLDGENGGLTATAVCSLTATPPRLLACINLSGRSYKMIAQSRIMAINVLGTQHEALARRFASADGGDPFDQPQCWTTAATGSPLLTDALASFDCTVEQMIVTSTHAIVIGDIRHIMHGSQARPLLYADGQFVSTGPLLAA